MAAPKKNFLDVACRAGVWNWDIRNDICRGDARLAEMFGIDPTCASDGIPLDKFINLVHVEDRAELLLSLARSIEFSGEYQASYRVNLPSGEIWIHAVGRCFDQQGVKRHEGYALDITELKQPRPEDARLELDMIAQHCLAAHRLCRFPYLNGVKSAVGLALKHIGIEIARGMSRPP